MKQLFLRISLWKTDNQGLRFAKLGTPKIKTLGVMWETEPDIFTFQVELPGACKEPTKRNVLSAIAALFDPLQSL